MGKELFPINLDPELIGARESWRRAYNDFCSKRGVNVGDVLEKKCGTSISLGVSEHNKRLTLPLAFEDLVTNTYGKGAFIKRVSANKDFFLDMNHDYVHVEIDVDSTDSTVLRDSIDPDDGPRVVKTLSDGNAITVKPFINFNMQEMALYIAVSPVNNKRYHPDGRIASQIGLYPSAQIPKGLAQAFPELLTFLAGNRHTQISIYQSSENPDFRNARDIVNEK